VQVEMPNWVPTKGDSAIPLQVRFRVVRVSSDDSLNIRASPSVSSPVIGSIPACGRNIMLVDPELASLGSTQQHGQSKSWAQVQWGNSEGWVRKDYLSIALEFAGSAKQTECRDQSYIIRNDASSTQQAPPGSDATSGLNELYGRCLRAAEMSQLVAYAEGADNEVARSWAMAYQECKRMYQSNGGTRDLP